MKTSIFGDCQIALDLSFNVGFKKKAELRKAITDNGGIVSYIVTKKSSFVVASDPEKCDVSSKCRMAVKYCVPVVNMDYIWDSVQAGKQLSIDRYTIAGKSKALDFRSGKISASETKTVSGVRRFTVKPVFNIRSVRVWHTSENDAPQFDEDNFEVAKYSVFLGSKKKQDAATAQFYALEIHVGGRAKDENGNECGPRYRLFSHYGSLLDALAVKPCTREMRYLATADQALVGYTTLYNEQLNTHKMHKVEGMSLRNVGSRKLQQILSVLESETGVASPCVQTIVEHIWREAMGEVDALLATPISSIKLDQIEKAEALLVKVRDLKAYSADMEAVLKEFYETLPHKTETADSVKPTRSWLSQKQDLCQLIRDMISVSEATSWSRRTGVQAKYRALRCNITHVEPDSQEYKLISEDILSSVEGGIKVNISSIYAVQRPVEDAGFRHDLDNKRNLFHSSRVENFLGILSRGLLMPKIVVNDFGGTRTDAGLLGSGIYFASAASKSALYSTPSKVCGTRLMVISEVALGQCCDYTTIDTALRQPPEGYDSVHGVSRKQDNSSVFENDEYVIYSVNQQRLRYLVEFTINEEAPGMNLVLDDIAMEIERSLDLWPDDIDLHDVQGVTDPMSRVKPGLVADKAEGQVELKAVHVRAKLIDLAAQVVVLQEYLNKSTSPIEAKYVFPLGDGAAVCGFEAFINDKHIVGEVKEKETAHKEYKQAISEGHGAYLMDQDEETPDVFTVSVGNLPPGATVLIKITYVAELQVDAELISFRLPGSVAPWKWDTATKDKTQDKLDTYKVASGQTSVQVAVEMPFDIKTLECPTHSVKVKRTASKAVVELRDGQDITDGFQLMVGLAEIHVPRMWVERQPDRPDHQACMLTFYPEFEVRSEVKVELVLLLDVSNSMQGTPLQSAKKVAMLILCNMDSGCTFNIVVFGTHYKELFPSSQAYSEENVAKAEKFIKAATADMGNTEVFRPLHAYFLLPPAEGATRNVLLLSDGHLNNETSVMADAHNSYHHTRIFTFGVSTTCNVYTLKSLARVSAGMFEFFDIKVKSKWEEKVKHQLGKAGQPGLTSVKVEWQQYDDNLPPPVQAPRRITALFNGTRQVIYGFVPNCTMAFLSAVVGGQEVSTVVSTSDLAITTGLVVHRLTARGIIQDWEAGLLSDDRTDHEVAKMNEKQDIIELSKEYSIVTQFTSFVAIEKRDKDEDMTVKQGSTIMDLVSRETVDILQYMCWEKSHEDMEVDQQKPRLDLVVKTLTGKSVGLSVQENLTVTELKRQIEEKEGIPLGQQRLMCAGIQLEDDKTLSDYGIDGSNILHVVLRLRDGPAEDIAPMLGEICEMETDEEDSDVTADTSSETVMDEYLCEEAKEEESDIGMGFALFNGETPVWQLSLANAADGSHTSDAGPAPAALKSDVLQESAPPVPRLLAQEEEERQSKGTASDEFCASLLDGHQQRSRSRSRERSSSREKIHTLVKQLAAGIETESELAPDASLLQTSTFEATFAASVKGASAYREEATAAGTVTGGMAHSRKKAQRALYKLGYMPAPPAFGKTAGEERPEVSTREELLKTIRVGALLKPSEEKALGEEESAHRKETSPISLPMLAHMQVEINKGGEAEPVRRGAHIFQKTRRSAGGRAPDRILASASDFLRFDAPLEDALFDVAAVSNVSGSRTDSSARDLGFGFGYGGAQIPFVLRGPSSFATLEQSQPLLSAHAPPPPPPRPLSARAPPPRARPPPSPQAGASPLRESGEVYGDKPEEAYVDICMDALQPPPQQPPQASEAAPPPPAPTRTSPAPPPPPTGSGGHPVQRPVLMKHARRARSAALFGSTDAPAAVSNTSFFKTRSSAIRLGFGFGAAASSDQAASVFSTDSSPKSMARLSEAPLQPPVPCDTFVEQSASFGGAPMMEEQIFPAGSVKQRPVLLSASTFPLSFGSVGDKGKDKEAQEHGKRHPLHRRALWPAPAEEAKQETEKSSVSVTSDVSWPAEGMSIRRRIAIPMDAARGRGELFSTPASLSCLLDSQFHPPTSPSYSPTSPSHVTGAVATQRGAISGRYHGDTIISDMLATDAAEPLLLGCLKKRKMKKMGMSSRWEDEEAYKQRKKDLSGMAEGLVAAAEDADFRSTKGRLPVVRGGASLETWRQRLAENEGKLKENQQESGSWKLDAELGCLIGFDVDTCKQLLQSAGIHSYGATAAAELEELLATVLVLLALFLHWTTGEAVNTVIDVLKDALTHGIPDTEGKAGVSKLVKFLRDDRHVERAVMFCMTADKRHPLACCSMELAPDWLTLGMRLFGLV